MAYIQAAQRGLRFLGRETSDPVYEVFKSWMRDYSTKRESQRGAESWEDLSSRSKWQEYIRRGRVSNTLFCSSIPASPPDERTNIAH